MNKLYHCLKNEIMHGFLNKLSTNKAKYILKIRLKIDSKFVKKNYGEGFFNWIKFTVA